MPFGWLHGPSLGLGLLAAGLRREGLPVRTLYLNLRFARDVGVACYESTMDAPAELQLGDWIFADALFGRTAAQDAAYMAHARTYVRRPPADPERRVPEGAIGAAEAMRARAGAFLDACAAAVAELAPRVVGFTCSYQQLFASLALARRVAAGMPGTAVVLGGPACHGAPAAEVLARFPFVDAVVSGEGDEVFPLLARRLLRGESPLGLAGVHARGERAALAAACTPAIADLDALPVPDHGEFFAQHAACVPETDACVLLEASRGCWWGERAQCAFCGLNGLHLPFRCKSPARALAEILRAEEDHPGRTLQLVDNILPLRFFRDVFPALARRDGRSALRLEIPCTLAKAQLRTLRDMRVWCVQPGIESLSTAVLRLLRKPATLLVNVQLLKWCRELRLDPLWNLLTGIPGTPPGEYARMACVAEKLVHLDPPDTVGPFVLTRYSPYFASPATFGLRDLAPHAAARMLYPFPEASVSALSSFFAYERDGAPEEDPAPLLRACAAWRSLAGTADLFLVDGGERLAVFDSRPGARDRVAVLSGLDRELLLACDAARPLRALTPLASEAEVLGRLEALAARCLVLHDGGSWLALPLAARPTGEYEPLIPDAREARARLV